VLFGCLVTQRWSYHEKSNQLVHDPRNFKALNMMSLKAGATTAPATRAYRGDNDSRIKFGVIKPKQNRLPSHDFTYGRPYNPQTPVSQLITHGFGEDAAANLQGKYSVWKDMVSLPLEILNHPL